jgi:hypothetical protein
VYVCVTITSKKIISAFSHMNIDKHQYTFLLLIERWLDIKKKEKNLLTKLGLS